MNNILTAIFKDNKYCHVSGLWQYDYGQVLRIQGLNLPKAVEIHFSLTESSGDSITRIGTTKDGATDVIIPDSMLENGDTGQNYNIYAFIFLTEIDSGNTEYRIKISVKARPKPEIPGTPEEPELFRETINAVNDAAERAETAERNAKVSEEAAAEHAKKTEGSVTELDTAREKALKEINDKKAEGVNAVVKQKETSKQSVTEHTDREIQRVTQKANEINNSLNKSITEASNKKSALDESANTSVETKKQLEISIESGEKSKADLDAAVTTSNKAKTDLNRSIEEATNKKTVLDKSVVQANELDKALGLKITEGNQLNKDIVASGNKAVIDINTAGDTKLKAMNDVAEEFATDREQINANKTEISSLKEDLTSKADKTALVQTDRKLDALWKLNQGISYDFQTDEAEAYQKTVPSGAKMVSIKSIGGKTTSDDAGEQMSAPVNEVVQQGKNYFDFSKLVSDGVNVIDYDNQTITVPAYTNNTGYNQTLRDLCPEITPGTYVFSMKRSNPESGAGSYFLEDEKDFQTDTPIELTDELLDNHIAWYNNPDSKIENVISEIQIEKNSAKTLYSQYYQKSHKIPQAILNLDGYGESGNFVDFVGKKYHKGNRTIDISDIMGDTFQEPLEVEAGGTLTFKNSHGDDYRIPVPSSEEYVVSLAEVAK